MMQGAPRLIWWVLCWTAVLLLPTTAPAQSPGQPVADGLGALRLVTYSGKLPESVPLDSRGACQITFALYRDQQGGAPLWQETQEVVADGTRQYTVQLGAMTGGVAADLFPSNQPRWLAVQPQGQSEQPRIQLASVPYAIKAAEADRLAGHSVQDFVTTEALPSIVATQIQQYLSAPPAGAAGVMETTAGLTPQVGRTLPATSFVDRTPDQVVSIQQAGSGAALRASTASSSAIVGTSNDSAAPGIVAAVEGISSLDGSFGVFAAATSRSSSHPGVGIHGRSDSPNGIGMEGFATGTGHTIGVLAQASSTAGFAIDATETATSGNTVGLLGRVNSPTGIGALILNNASETVTAPLISARTRQGVQFSVDGRGNVNTQGSLTAAATVKGAQLVATAADGTPALSITSTTVVPNLNASFLDGLSSSGFIQNGLTPQTNTNFNVDGQGTIGAAAIIGSNPSANGQVVIMPDNLDSVHSSTGEAGQNIHFRLSSAQPGPGGSGDFLIAPYTYGMALEYAGVLEAWVDDFSVHTNHRFNQGTPARFWVGDERDLGGLFVTARHNQGGTSSYVDIVADSFYHTSHGSLQFQVRDQEDSFRWQWGPYGSEETRAALSNSATATKLTLIYGPVQGVFAADSSDNGGINFGSSSSTPVSFVAGNTPVARIFPDGNLSIGNAQDTARLSVGSGGLFSVSDAGVVAAASLNASSISAASLSTASLTLSGRLSATDITASGTVTSNGVNTGALTATSINSASVTTPSLNVTSATAMAFNADSSASNSLIVGNGTAIVGHLSVVAPLDFGTIAANSCQTLTASLPGASDGDTVQLGVPNVLGAVDGVTWFGWVSAAGVVSIRGCNATTTPTTDLPAASIRFDIWKH